MAITRLSPIKNLKTTVKGAQNKKPEKKTLLMAVQLISNKARTVSMQRARQHTR